MTSVFSTYHTKTFLKMLCMSSKAQISLSWLLIYRDAHTLHTWLHAAYVIDSSHLRHYERAGRKWESTRSTWLSVLVCVPVDASAQWRGRPLKERVKIAMLIKGSWVPLRLHGLPHPSHPHSSLPSLPLSQWIYYHLPLSAGLLNGPQLLNFMPRVNLVTLMVAAELQWRGLALFFFF